MNSQVTNIRLVNYNLRLRSADDENSVVKTILEAGSKVKIITRGRYFVDSDGTQGNWCYVEVLEGARDRAGNPIPKGTRGWCFDGYLK